MFLKFQLKTQLRHFRTLFNYQKILLSYLNLKIKMFAILNNLDNNYPLEKELLSMQFLKYLMRYHNLQHT